ncbi:MAG: hypothetical protein H7099_04875 [Gemmatimonadaceae bacterium]|nr:hypothetical protein [Gemmatimonadaceae bacterium]
MNIDRPLIVDQLKAFVAVRGASRSAESGGITTQSQQYSTFILKKRAASRVFFDLHLEVGGILRSWVLPKGPSIDPAVRRLAVQADDHPLASASFEGVVRSERHGSGTVMLWDAGSYCGVGSAASADGLNSALRAGTLHFMLAGTRLRGVWTLFRTHLKCDGRTQWMLVRHRGGESSRIVEPTDAFQSSIATGRTMEEIMTGACRPDVDLVEESYTKTYANPPRSLTITSCQPGERP